MHDPQDEIYLKIISRLVELANILIGMFYEDCYRRKWTFSLVLFIFLIILRCVSVRLSHKHYIR